MGGRYPPLTCLDFKRALKRLGFEQRPGKGTSHEQWVGKKANGAFAKVTVDCPKAPFSGWLLSSMVNQVGHPKAAIYKAAFE